MARPVLVLAAAGILVLTSACDQTPRISMVNPSPDALRLVIPETAYRLSVEERAKVLPDFDADALERLLQMIRPDMREEILRHFTVREGEDASRGHLAQFHDPELQAVLEEVWAPVWDDLPDEGLRDSWYHFPGREVAMRRREARRQGNPEQKPEE